MATNDWNEDYPLEPDVAEALQSYLEEVREGLLGRAAWLSEGESISREGLDKAVAEFQSPVARSRRLKDVQDVISQALRENRRAEIASYVMILTLFGFGLFLLAVGAWSAEPMTKIGSLSAGTIVELLILAPLRFAIESRRHNIAIRMLGVILNRVDDPKLLAPLLKDTFLSIVLAKSTIK